MGIATTLIALIDATKGSSVWGDSICAFCCSSAKTNRPPYVRFIWPIVCPFIAPKTGGDFPFEGFVPSSEKCVGEREHLLEEATTWLQVVTHQLAPLAKNEQQMIEVLSLQS